MSRLSGRGSRFAFRKTCRASLTHSARAEAGEVDVGETIRWTLTVSSILSCTNSGAAWPLATGKGDGLASSSRLGMYNVPCATPPASPAFTTKAADGWSLSRALCKERCKSGGTVRIGLRGCG